jgi:hypothetical protein
MKLKAVFAVACAVLMISVASARADPPVKLTGAYLGAADPHGLAQFGAWRGSAATIASDYLGYSNWSEIQYPNWWLTGWQPFTSTGGTLVLGVPMLLQDGSTFQEGAAGQFDAYFEGLAQSLVDTGDQNTIIRLGWEFNGTWYPWSLSSTDAADSPSYFIADWRHIVTLMRSVPGADFKFVWNVNRGPEPLSAVSAYPGNAYVDYVGIDVYDNGWGPHDAPIRSNQARWKQITTEEYGLNWWLAFAHGHGKQLAIPEWGLDTGHNGGGDDSYFIAQMYKWMLQHHPVFESYFDYDNALSARAVNKASSEYRDLWSDSTQKSSGSARR